MDISKQDILQELEKRNGIVSIACKSIGLARSTFYSWLQADATFKAAVDELQEVALDFVEGKLMEKINGVSVKKGETDEGEDIVYDVPPSDTAIIFYLKTRGKKRGYIEKSEVDLRTPEGITIKYVKQAGNEPLENAGN
jgi:hypothetical protein